MTVVFNESSMRRVLHMMLRFGLIEIRASDSVNTSAKIADVFHNLPLALLGCSTVEDYEALMQTLHERAERCGLGSYIRGLQSVAEAEVSKSVT
ncbi:hypothetical protein [Stenotrophomonas sp.]|uniref:hypothetical protein n=1 Tax=Stenotrophomonas sp. TaxID=69392 RepID=UPI00289AA968|nr:hypothetical protein [Stenotrophomonas sp.]